MATNRSVDSRAEAVAAEYMNKNVYQRLCERSRKPCSFMRINDTTQQVQGVDVVIQSGTKTLSFDEKTAMYWGNRNLQTYSFEISWQNGNGETKQGWFLNDTLKTDYYVCIYCDLRAEQENGRWVRIDVKDIHCEEDIELVYGMIISKKKLRAKLAEFGITKEKMQQASDYMRKNEIRRYKVGDTGIKFVQTFTLDEQPVNIVVPRSILCEVADKVFYATSDFLMCE